MIELMAGPLIGDLTSAQSLALDGRLGGAPHHGELILAFDPRFFSGRDPALDQAGAEELFAAITGQGARLPSQRRFEARARSQIHGVQMARTLHADILALMNQG
jgi:LDH2 family malate/lactate/ureidoglycolate dehydrogenase